MFNNNCSFRKYWWNSTLNDAKRESLTHYNNWIAAGKPKDGPLVTAKTLAHKKYKNAVYAAKNK